VHGRRRRSGSGSRRDHGARAGVEGGSSGLCTTHAHRKTSMRRITPFTFSQVRPGSTGWMGASHPREWLSSPHPRCSIVDVLLHDYQGPLLLWSLHEMQQRQHTDPASYFQVAQLHEAYCTHWSPFFLLWHRAYVRKFEIELQKTAAGVARERFSNDERFAEAAGSLCLPYWDPIDDERPMPDVLRNDDPVTGMISVRKGLGPETESILSPLSGLRLPSSLDSTENVAEVRLCLSLGDCTA
jgi:hypothetical protein